MINYENCAFVKVYDFLVHQLRPSKALVLCAIISRDKMQTYRLEEDRDYRMCCTTYLSNSQGYDRKTIAKILSDLENDGYIRRKVIKQCTYVAVNYDVVNALYSKYRDEVGDFEDEEISTMYKNTPTYSKEDGEKYPTYSKEDGEKYPTYSKEDGEKYPTYSKEDGEFEEYVGEFEDEVGEKLPNGLGINSTTGWEETPHNKINNNINNIDKDNNIKELDKDTDRDTTSIVDIKDTTINNPTEDIKEDITTNINSPQEDIKEDIGITLKSQDDIIDYNITDRDMNNNTCINQDIINYITTLNIPDTQNIKNRLLYWYTQVGYKYINDTQDFDHNLRTVSKKIKDNLPKVNVKLTTQDIKNHRVYDPNEPFYDHLRGYIDYIIKHNADMKYISMYTPVAIASKNDKGEIEVF